MMGKPTGAAQTAFSRRELLTVTSAMSLSVLAGCTTSNPNSPSTETGTGSSPQSISTEHSSPELEKWVDEIPRPGVIEPVSTKDGQPYYEVEMREVEHEMHRDLPLTTVWGYDGQFPGPTIEARQGEPIYVRWKNKLPDEHLLPEDPTIHESKVPSGISGVRVVTHLHGGNVEHQSDGKPLAWFTRDFEQTGPKFEKKDYYYVNEQPPATLWYHDHSLGITRLNVYAGLSGFYLLRNVAEEALGLPAGEYELPLVLQDRSFNEDGSLFYPERPLRAATTEEDPIPSIVPHFAGDTSVVNGKAWPRLTVEPRKYRFRLLNGANSRYYNLKLVEYDERTDTVGTDGPPFTLVGSDGGLLSNPLQLDDRLELGVGARADVVADFADFAGQTLLLHNNAPSIHRGIIGEDDDDPQPLPEVLLIDVRSTTKTEDSSQTPSNLGNVPEIPLDTVDRERYITLIEQTDEYDRPLFLLGTQEHPKGNRLYDPVTEEPRLGDTEIWSFANLTGTTHPIHLHLVHFQILGRQTVSDYEPESVVDSIDSLNPPDPCERGWNDVVSVRPGEVTHVLVHFGEHDGLFNDQTGWYMYHCHMLEHEDHDMMRPFRVLPRSDDDVDDPRGNYGAPPVGSE